MAVDGSGSVIVSGYYRHRVDFNPGSGTTTLPTGGGGYIAKLNSSGGLAWARALERDPSLSYVVYAGSLATDETGNIYVTDTFYGTVDFDPGAGTHHKTAILTGEVNSNGTDVHRTAAFLLKLTSGGSFVWVETFGGTGTDSTTVAVDPLGLIHLAGGYQRTVDFDPNSNVAFDLTAPDDRTGLFLVKLRQN